MVTCRTLNILILVFKYCARVIGFVFGKTIVKTFRIWVPVTREESAGRPGDESSQADMSPNMLKKMKSPRRPERSRYSHGLM